LPVSPLSQDASEKIRAVAQAAIALRQLRRQIMVNNGWSLRELYKSLETPAKTVCAQPTPPSIPPFAPPTA